MTPIEELIRHYGYEGKELPDEDREHKVLCPFHNESNASATVNPAKGLFVCFGCEARGDVIALIRQQEEVSFIDAVRIAEDITAWQGQAVSKPAKRVRRRVGLP